MDLDDEDLNALSCNLGARPGHAAGFKEVLPFVLSKKMQSNTVIVDFNESGRSVVQSFIDAERLCCSELTWTVMSIMGRLRLRITGTPEQVSVVSRWFDK